MNTALFIHSYITRRFAALLLPILLMLSACRLPVDVPPQTLPSWRREFPAGVLDELARMPVLTLAEAQRLALEYNPDYESAFYAVRAARYRYYASFSGYLPNVRYRVDIGQALENNRDLLNPPLDIYPRENQFETAQSLSATLLLFDGFERECRLLAARAELGAQTALRENVARLLLRAVAYAYCDAILAEENMKIYHANYEFQTSSLAQAQIRYRCGFVSKDSVLNFQILSNEAQSARFNAQYRRRTARYALAALLGCAMESLPPILKLEPDPPDDAPHPLPPLPYYLSAALAARPDLRAKQSQLAAARYRKFAAWSDFLPTVSFHATLSDDRYSDHLGGGAVSRSRYHSLAFQYGLLATWDLFSGFSTVQAVRESGAMEQLTRFQLKSTFLDVVQEVKSAYADCENAVLQVQLYREMTDWVFEQRQLVAAAYWAGSETITRLNGAQSDLVGASARLALARVNLQKARARLAAAINIQLPNK